MDSAIFAAMASFFLFFDKSDSKETAAVLSGSLDKDNGASSWDFADEITGCSIVSIHELTTSRNWQEKSVLSGTLLKLIPTVS